MFTVYLKEEQEFLLGQRIDPVGESILEKGDVTVGKKWELIKINKIRERERERVN